MDGPYLDRLGQFKPLGWRGSRPFGTNFPNKKLTLWKFFLTKIHECPPFSFSFCEPGRVLFFPAVIRGTVVFFFHCHFNLDSTQRSGVQARNADN